MDTGPTVGDGTVGNRQVIDRNVAAYVKSTQVKRAAASRPSNSRVIAIDGDVNACDLIDDDWQGVNAVVVGCRQDIRAAGGEINCIRLAIRVGGVDRAFQSGDIAIGDVESSCLCFARATEQQYNSEDSTKNSR